MASSSSTNFWLAVADSRQPASPSRPMGKSAALTGPRDQGPVVQIKSGAPVSAGAWRGGVVCTMQRDRRRRQGTRRDWHWHWH